MKKLAFALVLCAASGANAQGTIECNEHGAVVTLAIGTTFYLGNNCDAARKGGGTGKWWLAASAFVVEIDGQATRLPFDIDCDLPACWSSS